MIISLKHQYLRNAEDASKKKNGHKQLIEKSSNVVLQVFLEDAH